MKFGWIVWFALSMSDTHQRPYAIQIKVFAVWFSMYFPSILRLNWADILRCKQEFASIDLPLEIRTLCKYCAAKCKLIWLLGCFASHCKRSAKPKSHPWNAKCIGRTWAWHFQCKKFSTTISISCLCWLWCMLMKLNKRTATILHMSIFEFVIATLCVRAPI